MVDATYEPEGMRQVIDVILTTDMPLDPEAH
jgi:hypothetical protein